MVFLKTKQNRKKKMKQIILAAMFMVLLMIRSSCADEITLHDGQVILGTITELKGDEIGVSTAKGMVVVHTRNLKAIILQNRYLNESFQDVVVNLAELNDWIQGKESIFEDSSSFMGRFFGEYFFFSVHRHHQWYM